MLKLRVIATESATSKGMSPSGSGTGYQVSEYASMAAPSSTRGGDGESVALSLMRQPRIGRSVRIEGCPRTSNHRIYMRARAVHLAGQGIESPYVNTPASQIGIRSPSSSMNTRSRVGTSMKT